MRSGDRAGFSWSFVVTSGGRAGQRARIAAPAGSGGTGLVTGIVGIEELGRRIRKLRVERRMTLKQVEQASDLSATHLSEIERGRTSPTIGALVRIARALDKEASYFIEAEERSDVAHVTREASAALPSLPGVRVEALTPGVPGSRII